MKKTPQQKGEELVKQQKALLELAAEEVIQKPIGQAVVQLLASGQALTLQTLIQQLQDELKTLHDSPNGRYIRRALDRLRTYDC